MTFTSQPLSDAPSAEHIQYIRTHVKEYSFYLNKEGIWLFLATIGCIGIPPENCFRLIGAILTFALFFHRFFYSMPDTRSLRKIIDDARARIDSEFPEGDTKKLRLCELREVERFAVDNVEAFRRSWPFFFCGLYSGVSLAWIMKTTLLA